MSKPEALRKAEEQVDAIHRQAYPEQYEKEKSAEEKAKEAGAGEHQDPPAGNTDKAPETAQSGSEAPPIAATAQEGIKAPEGEDWRQKYLVINGKYAAEVPVLHQKMRELEAEVIALRSGKPPEQAKQSDKQPDELEALLTRAREDYGDDFVKTVLAINDAKSKAIKGEVSQVVDQKLGEDAWGRFTSKLSGLIPDWESVNTSPEWKKWLGQKDATGKARQELLNAASDKLDAHGVAGIFNQFKGIASGAADRQAELESMIQPGKGKGGGPIPTNNKNERVFTNNEISKFYDDQRRGVYKGREAEANALEVEISAAIGAGRIR